MIKKPKPWWTSRAILMNLSIAIIAIIGLLLNMPEFQEWTPWLVLATNILNILVRIFLTSEPIGKETR